jgi:histidine triad (HIT) family protein
MTTLFSKIIAGEIPCNKVLENEHLIAFTDINPIAPVHILIVPKQEIRDLQSIRPDQLFIIEEIVKAAQTLAEEFDIDQSGYRLLTNCQKDGGQTIFHLHFHLIGGRPLEYLA